MTRVLITGGAGFIGSHVVEAALEAGLEPLVLDLGEPSLDVEHITGDVRDVDLVERAVRDVGLVCHQAAMVGLGVDLEDMPSYTAHNDFGTAVLLRALARARPRRLVLASSMVVYGEGRYSCPEHGTIRVPPRQPSDLKAGRFDSVCSWVPTLARARAGVGGGAGRSPQRLRGHESASRAPCVRVLARDRHPGHGTALPQRVRTANAPQHGLRGRRRAVRRHPGARTGPPGL